MASSSLLNLLQKVNITISILDFLKKKKRKRNLPKDNMSLYTRLRFLVLSNVRFLLLASVLNSDFISSLSPFFFSFPRLNVIGKSGRFGRRITLTDHAGKNNSRRENCDMFPLNIVGISFSSQVSRGPPLRPHWVLSPHRRSTVSSPITLGEKKKS